MATTRSPKPAPCAERHDDDPGAKPSRPIDPALHPIELGNYRVATPAIQAFYDLVNRCLRYHVTGALTYGPSRVGKTRAIEYLRMLLAETQPRIVTFHAQAEHKPRHAEGPFFANPLHAVGHPDPDGGTNSAKRRRLVNHKGRVHAPRQRQGGALLRRGAALRRERVRVGCVICTTSWTGCRSACTPSWSGSRSCWRCAPRCSTHTRRRSSRG